MPDSIGRSVLIINEGAYGNGNASLSLYNIDKDSIYNDVFFRKNNMHLGDVLQSMLVAGDYIFLAVNNSDKITVVRKEDFSFVKDISVHKPRYMLRVSDDKLYVTALYFPEINIIDLNSLEVTGKITVDKPNTEGMAMAAGSAFVCNWDTGCNYIYKIDPVTDSIMQRIPIAGFAPQQIASDKNNNLWIVAGNVEYQRAATITEVDPVSGAVIKSFSLPPGADIMKPVFNTNRDTLYYLGVKYDGTTGYNGVFRMGIADMEVPLQPFIAAQPLQYFYGIGIDTLSNRIYIADPKGFVQASTISIYDPEGTRLRSFQTEVGANGFYFE